MHETGWSSESLTPMLFGVGGIKQSGNFSAFYRCKVHVMASFSILHEHDRIMKGQSLPRPQVA